MFNVYRTGTPESVGGVGVVWRCTCTEGEPEKEGYPCCHLRDFFIAAREGQVVYDLGEGVTMGLPVPPPDRCGSHFYGHRCDGVTGHGGEHKASQITGSWPTDLEDSR